MCTSAQCIILQIVLQCARASWLKVALTYLLLGILLGDLPNRISSHAPAQSWTLQNMPPSARKELSSTDICIWSAMKYFALDKQPDRWSLKWCCPYAHTNNPSTQKRSPCCSSRVKAGLELQVLLQVLSLHQCLDSPALSGRHQQYPAELGMLSQSKSSIEDHATCNMTNPRPLTAAEHMPD